MEVLDGAIMCQLYRLIYVKIEYFVVIFAGLACEDRAMLTQT